jgi:hypothetical protein
MARELKKPNPRVLILMNARSIFGIRRGPGETSALGALENAKLLLLIVIV